MGYQVDLDEMSEQKLKDELARRQEARDKGNCDYCGRPIGVEPACKYPERHNGKDWRKPA